jgi:uncharacterized membrane protein (UPF0136 family)
MTNSKPPLPGMAAIALWMLVLAVLGVVGVFSHRYPTGVLALSTIFAAAGLGMIQRRRWGWALTLGAVFCTMCFGCYLLFRFRQPPGAFMAVINLVFFLYLVRSEVIGRLR